MALHIQMSEEAEAQLRRTALRNRLSSIGASLLLLFVGGLILFCTALVIMQKQQSSFIAYTPPAEDLPPSDTPVTQEVSSKASPAASDVSPTIIVAHGTTSTVMAPVNIDTTDGLDLSPSLDISMGEGMGGLGDGLGSGGTGMGSSSGGGSALEGTFYDLKQTRGGAKTEIANNPNGGSRAVLKEFFAKNWNRSVLGKYYQSKTKLYASTFYMPQLAAEYAPYAYQCSDKVQAKAVVAIYRGKVRAPKTGKFRFVAGGDEVVAIRFNNKTVLEWGYELPSVDGFSGNIGRGKEKFNAGLAQLQKERGYGSVVRYKKGDDPKNPNAAGFERFCNEVGLIEGTVFEVQEGKSYPIEILISEFGGGAFGFFVLIEDVTPGVVTPKVKSGAKLYQVFRTNFSNPSHDTIMQMVQEDNKKAGKQFNKGWNNDNLEGPPYDEDSLIWTAVP